MFVARRDLTTEDHVSCAQALETYLGVQVRVDRGFIWTEQPNGESKRWIRFENCFNTTRVTLKQYRVGKEENYEKYGYWNGSCPNTFRAETLEEIARLSDEKRLWMLAGCPCSTFVKVVGDANPLLESEMSAIVDSLDPWFICIKNGQHKYKAKVLC